MKRLPFRRDVERLPIFGLGCAGGALGLARAAALAQANARACVLLIVVELNLYRSHALRSYLEAI